MSAPVVVIEPQSAGRIHFGELWRYRDLFYVLTARDIRVRYKQTVFGAAWAVLQPVTLMIVFTVFFGRLAGVPSSGIPYALFAYIGLVPWTFFTQAVNGSATSLVENERLVTKVYFPRLLMPSSSAASYVPDFVIGHILMVGLLVYYDVAPRLTLVLLPVLAVVTFVVSLAIGVGLAALNVRYRDVRYAIPFVLQVLLFITPVVYPADLVSGGWRYVYALNPMSTIVDLYRWAIVGTSRVDGAVVIVSAFAALACIVASGLYFQRVERSFADVI